MDLTFVAITMAAAIAIVAVAVLAGGLQAAGLLGLFVGSYYATEWFRGHLGRPGERILWIAIALVAASVAALVIGAH